MFIEPELVLLNMCIEPELVSNHILINWTDEIISLFILRNIFCYI
jgi:hypothetical protein